MGKQIFVGCKLPHGLILDNPQTHPGVKVELTGRNKINQPGQIIQVGQNFGVTVVDAEFWTTWLMFHADYEPLKSGMLFAAEDRASLWDMGKERIKLITGFERADPVAHGVEATDKKQDVQQLVPDLVD